MHNVLLVSFIMLLSLCRSYEPDVTGIFLNDSLCLLFQIASFLKIELLIVALVVVGYS